MAFLTTDEFYEVVIHNTNDASWGALVTVPTIPSYLADAMINATTIVVYVIDSATGTFAFEGGQATGWDDSVLSSASAALSKLTTTADDGWNFLSTISGVGAWKIYDPQVGYIRGFSSVERGALKAFI